MFIVQPRSVLPKSVGAYFVSTLVPHVLGRFQLRSLCVMVLFFRSCSAFGVTFNCLTFGSAFFLYSGHDVRFRHQSKEARTEFQSRAQLPPQYGFGQGSARMLEQCICFAQCRRDCPHRVHSASEGVLEWHSPYLSHLKTYSHP